ncbi:hypothetical protein L6452_34015 [Arctium lappa]|uniref:Uncharacterized protein n=1 Tax=Arctium lappa TaxID=4217 RepID=A0ACB8YIL9_ARCLA|nr:hypothetical protein L6452_34015 [Arctium lappa]
MENVFITMEIEYICYNHIEIWIQLHLESRSSHATWTMMLPDFMYYISVSDDLSYVKRQCDGEQRNSGFPAWGTVERVWK